MRSRYTLAAVGDPEVPLLTFTLAGERCALPALDTREVVRAALPGRLPKAPPIVLGVLNVRGELVPVLDIRRRFGLPPRPLAPDDHMILTANGTRSVAFAVDRALDVVPVPREEIRAAADLARGVEHVAGVARMADGLVVIYDLRAFLSGDEATILDTALAEAARAS